MSSTLLRPILAALVWAISLTSAFGADRRLNPLLPMRRYEYAQMWWAQGIHGTDRTLRLQTSRYLMEFDAAAMDLTHLKHFAVDLLSDKDILRDNAPFTNSANTA